MQSFRWLVAKTKSECCRSSFNLSKNTIISNKSVLSALYSHHVCWHYSILQDYNEPCVTLFTIASDLSSGLLVPEAWEALIDYCRLILMPGTISVSHTFYLTVHWEYCCPLTFILNTLMWVHVQYINLTWWSRASFKQTSQNYKK